MIEDGETPPGNPVVQLLRSPFKWLFYSNLANAVGGELRLMAQAWLILELITNRVMLLAFSVIMGSTVMPIWPVYASRADKAMLGRVMAVYSMSIQIGMFGWFLGGWLGELIGNDWMLLSTGGAFALLHFALFLSSRELRRA